MEYRGKPCSDPLAHANAPEIPQSWPEILQSCTKPSICMKTEHTSDSSISHIMWSELQKYQPRLPSGEWLIGRSVSPGRIQVIRRKWNTQFLWDVFTAGLDGCMILKWAVIGSYRFLPLACNWHGGCCQFSVGLSACLYQYVRLSCFAIFSFYLIFVGLFII